MDRGAWWATVYGVAQSRTQLRRLSSSSNNQTVPSPSTGRVLWIAARAASEASGCLRASLCLPAEPSQQVTSVCKMPQLVSAPHPLSWKRKGKKKKSLVEAALLTVFPEALAIDFHLLITDLNHVTWPAVVAMESGKD